MYSLPSTGYSKLKSCRTTFLWCGFTTSSNLKKHHIFLCIPVFLAGMLCFLDPRPSRHREERPVPIDSGKRPLHSLINILEYLTVLIFKLPFPFQHSKFRSQAIPHSTPDGCRDRNPHSSHSAFKKIQNGDSPLERR